MDFDYKYELSVQDPELYMSFTEEQRVRFDQWYEKNKMAAANKNYKTRNKDRSFNYALFVHLSTLFIGYKTHSDNISNIFLRILKNSALCVLTSVGLMLYVAFASIAWFMLDRYFFSEDCYNNLQLIKHEKLRTAASYIVATLCAGCIATLLNFYGNW